MGATKLQEKMASSERHGRMLKTKKQAPSSSDILKAKKEAMAAVTLLSFKCIPRGGETWMDHWRQMNAKAAEEEACRPVKKRKRVLKKRLPKAATDLMVARPFRSVEDLTPAQLAKRCNRFRDNYALTVFVDGKLRAYQQALIRQYNTQGYVEDESEVTDSESEEDTALEN